MNNFVKNNILGVSVTSATSQSVLEYLMEIAEKGKEKCFVVTPNPEIVMYAKDHPHYKKILNEADLALCDGIGLYLAGQLLNKPFKDRITGVDMMEMLCKGSVKKPVSIGLLGARPGVAEKAAKCLREKYPGINILFTASELEELLERKRNTNEKNHNNVVLHQKYDYSLFPAVDILFVAFGFPKQEEWIATHLPFLPVHVAMGVGGAFDYISGEVKRAPFFLRAVGLEWLYRLIRQPKRLKRQLVLPLFFIKVLQKAIS